MLNLLLSLPEPNLVTFLFLLDHLKRYPVHPPHHHNHSSLTQTSHALSNCMYPCTRMGTHHTQITHSGIQYGDYT